MGKVNIEVKNVEDLSDESLEKFSIEYSEGYVLVKRNKEKILEMKELKNGNPIDELSKRVKKKALTVSECKGNLREIRR